MEKRIEPMRCDAPGPFISDHIPFPRSHEAPSREKANLETVFVGSGRVKNSAVMPRKDGKELFGINVCNHKVFEKHRPCSKEVG
jgi:hypothetical protein